MPFYSFKVHSPVELVLPEYLVTIGEGLNVFNVTLDDLEAFQHILFQEGVCVLGVHQLDDLEQVPADPAIAAVMSGKIPAELVAIGAQDPLVDLLGGNPPALTDASGVLMVDD